MKFIEEAENLKNLIIKKLCNQKILILYLFYGIIQWYNIYVKIFISCYLLYADYY